MHSLDDACQEAAQLLEAVTSSSSRWKAARGEDGAGDVSDGDPRGWVRPVEALFAQCSRLVQDVLKTHRPMARFLGIMAPVQVLVGRLYALWDLVQRRYPAHRTRPTGALFKIVHTCNSLGPDRHVTMTAGIARAALQVIVSRGRVGTMLLHDALQVLGWACSSACTAVTMADLFHGLAMVDVTRSAFKAAGVLDPSRVAVADLVAGMPPILLEPLVDVVAAAARHTPLLQDALSLEVCIAVAGMAFAKPLWADTSMHVHMQAQGLCLLRDAVAALTADVAWCVACIASPGMQRHLVVAAGALLPLHKCKRGGDRATAVRGEEDLSDSDSDCESYVLSCLREVLSLCAHLAGVQSLVHTLPGHHCARRVVEQEVYRRGRDWSRRRALWVYGAAIARGALVL